MRKFSLVKADLSRWVSAPAILGIGKWLPLLIAPFAILLTYGKVQSAQKQTAQLRVEQLTNDIRVLSTQMAQMEQFVVQTQKRATAHAERQQVLNNEKDSVLDMLAPTTVVDILRVGQETKGDRPDP